MIKKLVLLTAVIALSACSQSDKSPAPSSKPAPKGDDENRGAILGGIYDEDGDGIDDSHKKRNPKPGVPAMPAAPRATGPLCGTADGTAVLDGEKKKIEIRPLKTEVVNPCNIVKQYKPTGLEQYMDISFKGDGEYTYFYAEFRDDNLIEQLEPYFSEIQDRSYKGTRAPLKISVRPGKSMVRLLKGKEDNYNTAHRADCQLEVAPSPVVYRTLYKDDKGVEKKMDLTNNGMKFTVTCEASGIDTKLTSVEVTGYCWMATQTQTFDK